MHRNPIGFFMPVSKRRLILQSSLRGVISFAVLISTLFSAVNVRPAYAATSLTIMPITWNMVGLDSNDETVGPDNFPVGVRVCNAGGEPALNVSADFVWDETAVAPAVDYINLRSGSLNPITLSSLSNIAPNNCHDFYFEITVTRDPLAYDDTRDYHIAVTADNAPAVQTSANREIFVEHLVSQNRNSVLDIKLDTVSVPAGGAMNLNIGQTYDIQLLASTATNGYEQIESFINFPNTIFLINSVSTTYSHDEATDAYASSKLYADGCGWINDTTDPNYHTHPCTGVGKYGDTVTINYNVTIIATSGSSGTLNTLIYDYSGSSYHYNSDFALSARIYNIIDPNACTQSTIAQWNFPTNGTILTPSTDNAVGTPTWTTTGLTGPSDVVGNLTRAASYSSWNTTGTLNTATDFAQFTVNTQGYYNIQFSFDGYRSNSGPTTVDILYYDGALQNPSGTGSLPNQTTWYSFSSDYASVPSLDNYSGAYFRVYGYNSGAGNLRFDNVTVTGCKFPSGLNLAKTADKAYFTAAGQTITYTYTLTNSGQVSLQSPYTITDDKVAPVNISCAGATSPLAPGASTTCTGTYVTTAADVTAGTVTNLATASATTVIGDPVTSNQATKTIPLQLSNFGHLPSNYLNMNLYADDGAMHLSGTTMFGSSLTSATDGINTVTYTPKASDDGVTFTPSVLWSVAAGGSLDITAACPSAPCYMNAWFDWNKDGDFNDPGEQVFSNQTLNDGTVTLTFSIPVGTVLDGTFYSRFRIYDQLPSSVQPNGPAMSGTTLLYGEIEDPFFNINGGVVTPVTLSWFKAERQGNQVQFNWATATETGNLGFNLYVERGGNLELLNQELIPSSVIDSLSQQNYTFTAQADGDIFYIEDVDLFGETRHHGPFALGGEFGSLTESDPIDWEAVAADQSRPNPLQADLMRAGGLANALHLKVRQSGLYRVTYEMLRDAGLDLANVNPASITLTLGGRAVPIYVFSAQDTFGPGGYVEFHGRALNTLYTDTNVYTIKVSQAASPRIAVSTAVPPRTVKPVATYLETLVVDNQRTYTSYTPGTDPWYNNYIFVQKTSSSLDFPFNVTGLANSTAASTLNLTLWGMIEMPQSPDHHVLVSINGVQVASQTFDGLVENIIKASIPAGVLKNGANTLTLTLPADTGAAYDLVYLDKFSITYPHLFRAENGRLTFTAAGKVFRVTNLPTPNVVVYQLVKNRPVRVSNVTVKAAGSAYMATFAGSTTASTYLVSTAEAMLAPELANVPASASLNQPAQYLIISHPDFIAGIQPLVQARQAQGLTVSVVNVNDLYARYTFGVFDPKAIRQYIAYAAQNLGTQYVLLVGGDTYDYRNYLGKNSVSFVPSLYVATSPVAKFVPSDPLYTDLNGDKIPDLAIGRFPVRTAAELELMVNKTLAYQSKDYGRTAVFATDKMDGLMSFKGMSTNMALSFPSDWSVENIHLDDMSVSAAQTQLLDAMNRGTALVTFTGHSGPTKWTFSGLFGTKNIAALTNAGRPFVVVQWGCWNTYYVDPVNNYLVQSFLFSGDRGAAAVLGASTLTDSASEALLGKLLMPRLVTPGMSMGQALQDAKHELALTHPELLDVLLGWSLMGDPALVIEP